MNGRQVPASHGWLWIRNAFYLLRANPVMWVVIFVIYLVISLIISKVPYIGPMLMYLLSPIFLVGIASGARAIDAHEELLINHLFEGFKKNTAMLAQLGFTYGACSFILLVVALTFQKLGLPELLISVIVFGLMLPILMGYFYAPQLIFFKDMDVNNAIRASFIASWRNLKALTVFSIPPTVIFGFAMVFVVGVVASAMYGETASKMAPAINDFFSNPAIRYLMAPLVFISILVAACTFTLATTYTSFKDVFEDAS